MAAGAGGTALRRELLDRVLAAVRDLGKAGSFEAVLQRIADDVVGILEFSAAALNVRSPDGRLRVLAVAGPDGARELMNSSADVAQWDRLLGVCTRSGDLYFLDHRDADHPDVLAIEEWVEAVVPGLPDEVWQAHDTLLAALRDADGALLGVLSADLAVGASHDYEQRTAFELFATQAARTLVDAEARDRLDGLRRDAERRWQLAWESGLVAAGVIDELGYVTDVNDAAARALGWERQDMIGRHFLAYVAERTTDVSSGRFEALQHGSVPQISERVLRHRDGRDIWCLMHSAVVVEGGGERSMVIVQWIDITERKVAEQRMVHQLHHDALTDLPNRRALEELLADLFDRDVAFGLLYCDIDGFKSIADGLGHEAGDELLRLVAARLGAQLGPDSVLNRLAGDEFVVCVLGTSDVSDVAAVATGVTDGLAQPFVVEGYQHVVRMSIGISTSRSLHHHPLDILREADQALLRAKRRGRSRIEIFDPGQDRPTTRGDLELEHALRGAVEDGRELEPFFQSVISLTSGATVGYEALLRWRHPGHGVLLPGRFLPIAERAGLSAALGWRMLDLVGANTPKITASEQARPWIAVNVSAAQLGRGLLPAELRRVLEQYFDGDPDAVHIEITETSLLDASPATIDELYEVADLGVGIALDDFGTGYSSLTLLRDLPVSAIKIDRSFIAPIAVDVRARTIVQHTIELCQGLGMTTIAEGIETHEQLAWLQTLGCELGQGYLIDRPSPWPFDVPDQVDPSSPRRLNGLTGGSTG